MLINTCNMFIYGDGGDRPQRGFIWGNPPPTRVIMGEPVPNAGYCKGDRKGYRWLFILPLWCLKKELGFSKS